MCKSINLGVSHEHVVYTDVRSWNRRTSSSSLTKPQSRQMVHVCSLRCALIAAEQGRASACHQACRARHGTAAPRPT
jgi:hypothetical protein